MLYELVHGRAPFTGTHPREISDKIMRGVIRFKPGLSNEYKDLVNAILKYECSDRLPLIKVFDHPWVRNFEKKYNLCKVTPPPVIKSPSKEESKKREVDRKQKDEKKKEDEKKAAILAAQAASMDAEKKI